MKTLDQQLKQDLLEYLDSIEITSENIGDSTITTLLKLQQSRRDYLRRLSVLRGELQTYELRLEA